jgi:hypothetical protein
MNIIVNDLAQTALRNASLTNTFFDGIYPNDNFIVTMRGIKTTGPIGTTLETLWGQKEAQQFFHIKNIVHAHNSDLIWWDGVGKAMASYPKMFKICVSKKVSGWCGSNSKQSLWDTTISNMCPNCGTSRKTSKHLSQCQHVGRVQLFRTSIADVISCFEQANIDVDLIIIIENYLFLQGSGEDPQIPTTARPSSIGATKPPKPLSCRLAAPINKLGNIYHQYCSSSYLVYIDGAVPPIALGNGNQA